MKHGGVVEEPPLISLRDIHRAFELPDGEILHILRGVNLEVMPGEHVSIVGRSGTGKSTLLGIMGLIDRPNWGAYFLEGSYVYDQNSTAISLLRGSHVGFVFQQFNLFSARSILDNVAVPLLYAQGQQFWKRNELAAQMLERVGLGDRLHSRPSELSGGEQQRVAIARALVRQPRIILADEPTGALDVETGEAVMELLETTAAQVNAALIVITHDLRLASRADRVLTLYDGTLHTETGEVTTPGWEPEWTQVASTHAEVLS